MRIGVVGAGISGLAATKVLTSVGHEVVTFDRVPDVGGVWSATRQYPGLRTQNTRMTYGFSDHTAPDSWPERPSAGQWQSHLQAYVDKFGFGGCLRLCEAVQSAKPTPTGWDLKLQSGGELAVDHLVAANGVYSEPAVPAWPGRAEHEAAGGVVKAPSQSLVLEDARGKDVVVVGYGKSACDLATSLSAVSRSLTVVARRLMWKGSLQMLGRDGEDIGLSRMTEQMFARPRAFAIAWSALRQAVIRNQGLREVGLVPGEPFHAIARNLNFESEGFVSGVRAGAITVRRDRSIASLGAGDQPHAVLDDGSAVPAELVVPATGFKQSVPFLDPTVTVQNAGGDFDLFRRILPHDAPRLTFCGYNSSSFSAINAEVAAIWTAAYIGGALDLPPIDARRAEARAHLEEMARQANSRSSGTSVIPFSIRNMDQMLSDMGAALPERTRRRQWVRRAYPGDYRRELASVLTSLS